MLTRTTRTAIGGLLLASTAGLTASVVDTAHATTPDATVSHAVSHAVPSARKLSKKVIVRTGTLNTLNNSGVYGKVSIRLKGRQATVKIKAFNLAPNLPHAAHIHWSVGKVHRCPTSVQDTNNDGRVNVAEGTPVYGDIVKSLTTKGDSSPASALAVDRFPTTPQGKETYKRTIKVKVAVAKAIRRGNVHIVLHGVDFNGNGAYDFDSAGASEIAPSLPAEATDPAACGVLRK